MTKKYFKYILFSLIAIFFEIVNVNAEYQCSYTLKKGSNLNDFTITYFFDDAGNIKDSKLKNNLTGANLNYNYSRNNQYSSGEISGIEYINGLDAGTINKLTEKKDVCPNLYGSIYNFSLKISLYENESEDVEVIPLITSSSTSAKTEDEDDPLVEKITRQVKTDDSNESLTMLFGKTKSGKYYYKFSIGSDSFDERMESLKFMDVKLKVNSDVIHYQIQQSEAKNFWDVNNKSNVHLCKMDTYIRIVSLDSKVIEKYDGCTIDKKSSENKTITVKGEGDTINGAEYKPLSSMCQDNKVKNIFKFLGHLITIVKILIPLGLIIFGAVTFGQAMISGDNDALKKNAIGFIWKLIAAIVIFVIPTIINLVISFVDEDSNSNYTSCSTCLFDTKNCK